MISPETPIDVLAEIVKQLARIADSLEAMNKNFEAGERFNVAIQECPVIKIRSN